MLSPDNHLGIFAALMGLAADQFPQAATHNTAINQLASRHESHSANGC